MTTEKADERPTPAAEPSKRENDVRDAEDQDVAERERERQGNRGPEQEPGFGQGA